MIHIAIVEDDFNERKAIINGIEFVKESEKIEISIDEFENPVLLLSSYKPIYDIVLMDIDMPKMNGFDASVELRKIDKTVLLIFVTNLAQYAIKGYEVEALDFIVKPINKFSFLLKMKRAISRTSKRIEESLQIKVDEGLINIQVPLIQYIESDGHYLIIHSTDGVFKTYSTLKDVENKIKSKNFVRCNRCYLVNLKFLTRVEGNFAIVGKDQLLISRPQRKNFLDNVNKFISGN